MLTYCRVNNQPTTDNFILSVVGYRRVIKKGERTRVLIRKFIPYILIAFYKSQFPFNNLNKVKQYRVYQMNPLF